MYTKRLSCPDCQNQNHKFEVALDHEDIRSYVTYEFCSHRLDDLIFILFRDVKESTVIWDADHCDVWNGVPSNTLEWRYTRFLCHKLNITINLDNTFRNQVIYRGSHRDILRLILLTAGNDDALQNIIHENVWAYNWAY